MGEKIASSLSTFFNDAKNIKTLNTLKDLGLKISNPDYVSGKKEAKALEDLTFVITGTLPKPRKEVEELIEQKEAMYLLLFPRAPITSWLEKNQGQNWKRQSLWE